MVAGRSQIQDNGLLAGLSPGQVGSAGRPGPAGRAGRAGDPAVVLGGQARTFWPALTAALSYEEGLSGIVLAIRANTVLALW